MQLQPLTADVLDAELKTYLATWSDVSRLADLVYFPVTATNTAATLTAATTKWVTRAAGSFNSPDAVAKRAVIGSITGPGSVDTISKLDGIFRTTRDAGVQLLYAQIGAIVGETTVGAYRTLSPGQATYVHDVVNAVVLKLDAGLADVMTPPAGSSAAKPADFAGFLAKVSAFIDNEYRVQKLTPDLVAWLFPPEVTAFAVSVALEPWLKMRYIGRLIGGDSFYDSRYAEMVVFQAMGSALQLLYSLESSSGSKVQADVDKLSVLYDSLAATRSAISVSETSGTSMLEMYKRVAGISTKVRQSSTSLGSLSADFAVRRDRADNLGAGLSVEEAAMKKKKRRFLLWVMAFAVTVAVSVVMLLVATPQAFMLQAGCALGALTIYLVAVVIARAVSRARRNV